MTAPVLVTGAGGTIGSAIHRKLADAGHRVIATDARITRGPDALEARLPDDVERLAATLPEKLGGLVHAIGRIATHDVLTWSDTLFDELFHANVLAPLRVTAALADRLERGSVIVFVGSVAGMRPTPNNLLYGATKAALHHAATTLALTMAPRGIRVNVVAPGLIDGPLTERTDRELAALTNRDVAEVSSARVGNIPAGRIGTAEDIAASVAFVMSSEASFMSGAVIPITGGGHL